MKKAVMYLRGDEESIYKQYSVCKEYAAKNNIEVITIYDDSKSSGANMYRKELNKMLSRDDIDIVLAYNISRLARNSENFHYIVNKIKNNGVELIIVNQPEFNNKNTLNALVSLLNEFDVNFREELSEKNRKAKLNHLKKGNFSGTVPFGYVKGIDNKMHIVEDEAKIIIKMFEMFSQHKSLTEIKDYLNKNGVKTRTNKDFSISSISIILNNSLYNGKYVFNKYKNDKTEKKKNKKIMNPESEWLINENLFPPIISDELFSSVKQILDTYKLYRR